MKPNYKYCRTAGLKMLVLVISLMLLDRSASFATTYYFSTSGSDTNAGTSTTLPKKTIGAALALMTTGNTVNFKRGDTWYISTDVWPMQAINLNGVSNVTLGAWGTVTDPKPVIAALYKFSDVAGAWSTVAGHTNVYKQKCNYFYAERVFVNGTSRIDVGLKYGNTESLASLDSTDEYYYADSTLYLKMPSAVAPTNVEIVPAVAGHFHGAEAVVITSCSNILLQNIDFRGGSSGQVILINAPSDHITIDNCVIQRSAYSGIIAVNGTVNTNKVDNINITNCIIDKGWTLAENNLKHDYNDQTCYVHGDGIGFYHAVTNGLIKGNKILNWGHSAVQLTCYLSTSSSVAGIHHIKVEQNETYADKSGYIHGFDISGFDGKTTGNIIKRNWFHDTQSAVNIAGSNNFLFSNIFSNITVSPIYCDSHQPMGAFIDPWINGSKMESRYNWVINNVFYNTDAYSVKMNQDVDDSTFVRSNKIYNNIMMNFGRDTTYQLDPNQHFQPTTTGFRIYTTNGLAGVNEGTTFFKNNNFWINKPDSLTHKVAQYGSSLYTASQLNSCAECGAGRVVNNVQLNPHFGAFFNLTAASSATLRTGGIQIGAALETAIQAQGWAAGEYVDYYGNAWNQTATSIGAIQY